MNTPPIEPDDQRPETWLREALDDVDVPPARPQFRAELRERFVAADKLRETPDDAEFVSQPAPDRVSARAKHRSSTKVRTSALDGRNSTPSTRRRWALGLVAAALATAAALALYFNRPEPRERVQLVESALASFTVDGVKMANTDEFVRKLQVGARLETTTEAVRVRLDGAVLIELAAGTRLTLAAWDESADGETLLELASGGVRVLTGPTFAPRHLRVRAPDADIAIVGTEFGVDVIDGSGTCVCCTKGAIDVRARGQDAAHRVLAGGMSFCFSSGEAPMLGDVKSDHADDVTKLRRFW